jgi:hypothetical protein
MALIVDAKTFHRLFAGVRASMRAIATSCSSTPKDEDTAAKIEDEFALHISIIASKIMEREINVVMVLPRQLVG